ncbi:MAG: hypothetical protein M0036_25905 [Desulfobacteraceae bacterium]|nr:hypothetical protein [Desulfobacteraceae bacterium]
MPHGIAAGATISRSMSVLTLASWKATCSYFGPFSPLSYGNGHNRPLTGSAGNFGDSMADEPIFYGVREIAAVLVINRRLIPFYVKAHGLPAFRDSDHPKAAWRATRASLERWAAEHERKMLGLGTTCTG